MASPTEALSLAHENTATGLETSLNNDLNTIYIAKTDATGNVPETKASSRPNNAANLIPVVMKLMINPPWLQSIATPKVTTS